jgi:hypothetical protein
MVFSLSICRIRLIPNLTPSALPQSNANLQRQTFGPFPMREGAEGLRPQGADKRGIGQIESSSP